MESKQKTCRDCKVKSDISDFALMKNNYRGSYCSGCRSLRAKRYKIAIRKKDPQYYYRWKKNKSDKKKDWARITLRNAVNRGHIIRPSHCSSCLNHKSLGRIEADHEDYSKPLVVTWLCRHCHLKKTVERRAA